MMGHRYGMMGGFGMIIPIIIIGLVIYIAFSLASGNRKITNRKNHKDLALDILRQRYAKGEISEEEYFEKKRVLED